MDDDLDPAQEESRSSGNLGDSLGGRTVPLLNGLPGVTGYNLLIGRSDATALFFFLLLILVTEIKVTQSTSLLLRGLWEGLLMGLCALTNTRFVAAVGAYYLYVLLTNRFIVSPPRHLIIKRVGGAGIALLLLGLLLLFGVFKGDLNSYYLHFFGHFLDSRAHALVPIAPFEWFPEQLFSGNRTPLLSLWLIVMLLELWTYRRQKRTQTQRVLSVWMPLVALYLATMVGYWLNRRGGGTYYFNPWIVWLFIASLRVHQLAQGLAREDFPDVGPLPGRGAGEDLGEFRAGGVADQEFEEEAVELGFGQGISPLLVNGVLGRHDEERLGQFAQLATGGDLMLCMASRSADCVLGVARLISSARRRCAKTGPCWNSNCRRPPAASITMFVPRMSAGMRFGVNWILLKERSSTSLRVRTNSVFPSPGTPSSRTCPWAKRAVRTPSTMAS